MCVWVCVLKLMCYIDEVSWFEIENDNFFNFLLNIGLKGMPIALILVRDDLEPIHVLIVEDRTFKMLNAKQVMLFHNLLTGIFLK